MLIAKKIHGSVIIRQYDQYCLLAIWIHPLNCNSSGHFSLFNVRPLFKDMGGCVLTDLWFEEGSMKNWRVSWYWVEMKWLCLTRVVHTNTFHLGHAYTPTVNTQQQVHSIKQLATPHKLASGKLQTEARDCSTCVCHSVYYQGTF